jgi:hypothetical protein
VVGSANPDTITESPPPKKQQKCGSRKAVPVWRICHARLCSSGRRRAQEQAW